MEMEDYLLMLRKPVATLQPVALFPQEVDLKICVGLHLRNHVSWERFALAACIRMFDGGKIFM